MTASTKLGAVLPGLMLVMLLGALDQTIMAPALPAVAGDLGGLDQMPAVVTAYLAAATAVMPIYGKLGDRFGRKRVLQAALCVFVAGAMLCSLTQSMPQLVAARAVQGAGGGGLMIGAQTLVGELVSPRERGRYLGLIGGAYIVAAVAGPLAGGFFVDHLTWRWIFYLYPVIGAVAFVVVAITIRLPRPTARPPVDYAGAVLLAVAVVGLVVVTTNAGSTAVPGWLVPVAGGVTVAAVAGWVVTARRAADPIIPLRLFRDRSFAIPGAISFLLGFALFGTVNYVPAFLQVAVGTTASTAGLLVTSLMAGVLLTTTVSGRLITRTGRYTPFPIAGTAIAAAGLALLATADADSAPAVVAATMFVLGFGIGLVMQVMVLAVQNTVAYEYLGAATSTVTFLRQIGSSVGVAVVGGLVTARFADRLPGDLAGRIGAAGDLSPETIGRLPAEDRNAVATAFGDAVPPVFGYLAPLLVLAFVLAIALPARPLRTTAHVTQGAEQ